MAEDKTSKQLGICIDNVQSKEVASATIQYENIKMNNIAENCLAANSKCYWNKGIEHMLRLTGNIITSR